MIYPRLRTGFGILFFFTKLSLAEFQVRYLALFLLFSVIDGFGWFWMRSLHKNIQLMLELLKAPFFILHFSFYTLMTFLMMLSVILLSMLMILHSTLKCDQASQQLELASELESDLWVTVNWGRKWLIDFDAGNFQLVSFDRSNDTGAIDVKIDGSVLEEKSSFKMLRLTFSSKLNWDYYITSIVKSASRKIGILICSMKFLFSEAPLYLYKSTIQPCMEYCCHACLVLLVGTWNFETGYKNGYAWLLVLPLLPVLNPWFIVEM